MLPSNEVAEGYTFYEFFFFDMSPSCDQTADRRRVKSIPAVT